MVQFFIDIETPIGSRIVFQLATYVGFALWLKLVVAKAPLGATRVLLSLPIFAVNMVCPFFFSNTKEILHRTSAAFIFSWLCNFKVLAFCWGREPLRESMTLPQLTALVILPLFPKPPERTRAGPEGRLQDSAGPGASLASRWLGKIVLLGVMVFLIMTYGNELPGFVRHYLYAFGLYAFVGFLMDGPAAVAVEALGLQLIPTFDQPWMSTSLADFWGRRWNIPTSTCLRTVVYDTIIDGSAVNPRRRQPHISTLSTTSKQTAPPSSLSPSSPLSLPPAAQGPVEGAAEPQPAAEGTGKVSRARPSLRRRQLGLCAVFLMSGIVHEYIAWVVHSENSWGWKWLVFFSIQAPLMAAEDAGRRRLRAAGRSLPRWLSIGLTLGLLEALAYPWFFGFVETDTDIAARVLRAVADSYVALLEPVQPQLTAGWEWLVKSGAVAWGTN